MDAPVSTVTLAALADKVKDAGGVTVNANCTVLVTSPPVALIATVALPSTASAAAVKVTVVTPEPGALSEAGANAAVTPFGSPLSTEKLTEELKPPTSFVDV